MPGWLVKLRPCEIKLTITAPGRKEEIESWKEVFGIEERYKTKCCSKNDGKYWLVQAIEESQNVKEDTEEMIKKIEKNAEAYPWAECNFLKRPFLLACQNAGLIRKLKQ